MNMFAGFDEIPAMTLQDIKETKRMRRSRKFCQKRSKFEGFLVDDEWEDPNTTISGPSTARQRNAI